MSTRRAGIDSFAVNNPHGTKYNQVINIIGANGKAIDVTFAWIRNNDGVVRLVTAIPAKR
jgi:filamentous hemagglutinin